MCVIDAFQLNSSSLLYKIKKIHINPICSDIRFFWSFDHTSIYGNEFADSSTSSLHSSPSTLISWIEFCPVPKKDSYKLRSAYWQLNLPLNFSSGFGSIIPSLLFNKLNLNGKIIVSFSHLRFCHSLLSSHDYKLSLNDSSLCSLYSPEAIYDIFYLLFRFPYFFLQR